jgi:membrane-bound lytic murein transglycosylase D
MRKFIAKTILIFCVSSVNYVIADEVDKNQQPIEPVSIRDRISNLLKKPTGLWLNIAKGYQLTDFNYLEVGKLIRQYSASSKNLQATVNNASLYLPFIYQEVTSNKLPAEIVFLPFLESGYDPRSSSGFKSSGLWGLMPIADKELGLDDNLFVQDRRDIVKSTRAALSLLKKLNNEFGNWEHALAAYNAGPGRVKKAIQDKADKGELSDHFELDLQKETLDYVPKLIALRTIFNTPNLYGISLKVLPEKSNLVQIEIAHDIDIAELAKFLNLSTTQFYDFNPQYKKNFIPGAMKSKVLIPETNFQYFEANRKEIEKVRCNFYAVKVRRDITLLDIAKEYDLDAKTFFELNGPTKFKKILSGSTIIIKKNRRFSGDIPLKVIKNSFIQYG